MAYHAEYLFRIETKAGSHEEKKTLNGIGAYALFLSFGVNIIGIEYLVRYWNSMNKSSIGFVVIQQTQSSETISEESVAQQQLNVSPDNESRF